MIELETSIEKLLNYYEQFMGELLDNPFLQKKLEYVNSHAEQYKQPIVKPLGSSSLEERQKSSDLKANLGMFIYYLPVVIREIDYQLLAKQNFKILLVDK